MARREYELGAVELEVLKALWVDGPATVREVMNYLHQRGRRQAYTTVQTVLTRLEQKGFVRSDKSGLAYVYRSRISRERISRSRLEKLLSQLYDGAAGPLVMHLVESERLTVDEINKLQELIDRLDSPSDRT
ncbi:MAG: BlaI/MecI/CopY family transcriptional regulator [Planctomycetes bacterium]|nr:BlaI/MecI/CopY family transcriptional regulator [Planctomycetota bacterium]